MKNTMEKLKMITGGLMSSSAKKIQYFMNKFQCFCQGLRQLKRMCMSHAHIASMIPTQKIQNQVHPETKEEMVREREPIGKIKEAADYSPQEVEETIVRRLPEKQANVKIIMQEGEEETEGEEMGKQSLVAAVIVAVIVSRDVHPT